MTWPTKRQWQRQIQWQWQRQLQIYLEKTLERATQETCDLSDIWSEWWGDMTWPTERQWQRQRDCWGREEGEPLPTMSLLPPPCPVFYHLPQRYLLCTGITYLLHAHSDFKYVLTGNGRWEFIFQWLSCKAESFVCSVLRFTTGDTFCKWNHFLLAKLCVTPSEE